MLKHARLYRLKRLLLWIRFWITQLLLKRFNSAVCVLQIHWFSIINSCVTVLLLTGFLSTILLRVLKNDFMKYTKDDEMGEEQEETGWKYLHGDVFRVPPRTNLFCAMMGVGSQMLIIAFSVFILALVGVFYPHNRGALLSACVILYALTAGVAGMSAAPFHIHIQAHVEIFCGSLLLCHCALCLSWIVGTLIAWLIHKISGS